MRSLLPAAIVMLGVVGGIDRQRRRVVFESRQEQAFVSKTQEAIVPDDPLPAHEGTLAFC